ncbi:MAG: AraC family transcriptional regulator [Lentisphaeria bacterium]|nr:AraC family transcriptional regulator [Lentisphaeria bacterium]
MKKKAEGFSDHIAPVWHHSSAWAAGNPQTRQLWPLAVTETEYHNSHWWELRNIPFLALELVLQGELTAEVDHRKFHLRPGDLLILNHPGRAVMRIGKHCIFRKSALLLHGTMLDTVLAGFSLDHSGMIKLRDPGQLERDFRHIAEMLDRKAPESIHALNGRIFETLSRLSAESAQENSFPESLNRAIRNLTSRPDINFSLKQLAESAGCSVPTLQRNFRRYCGTTPHEYSQNLRMILARQLLRASALSIKEIAERLGYSHQAYFSNDFKKTNRVSPLAYRRNSGDML